MERRKTTNRSRKGQNEVVTTVILIAVVLVLAAVFIIISMINFGKASASTSLSLAESFMTDVADDIEASMYNPGTVLVYPLPNTQYGMFNFINNYCTINVNGVTYYSGALIYGTPPNYASLPSGYIQVIRGSTSNGAYNIVSESTVIQNAAAPLISIVQYGTSTINGVSYGTYIALFPRVLVINESGNVYVYVPIIKVIPSGLRNELIVNITGIAVNTITGSPTSPLTVSITDNCIGISSPQPQPISNVLSLRVIVINVTMTFR